MELLGLYLPVGSVILIIGCLLIFSAFFSASEISLFSFRKTRLAMLVKEKHREATMVHEIMQRPESVLSTILVGNSLVTVAASVLASGLATLYFPQYGLLIATGVVTFMTVQFAEVLPKLLGSQFWEKTAFFSVRPLKAFSIILYPFVAFFSVCTRIICAPFGIKIGYRAPFISKEELRHIVAQTRDAGYLKEDEILILQNVFKFTDSLVKEVMLPRERTDMLDINSPQEAVLKMITEKHHTRLPVYEGSPDNIVGVFYTKEYLNVVCYGGSGLIILHDLIRPPYFVEENSKISEVLKELRQKRVHLAIVRDKQGHFTGIITIEDILEEIVGDIMDEHDIELSQN